MSRVALVLAAGEGTRMKSRKPKVIHRVCGKPMISWILDTLEEVRGKGYVDRVLAVVGHGADEVREEIGDRASCLIQEERRGTGHAVMVAAPYIEEDEVLILTGDSPLIRARTLIDLCDMHRSEGTSATLLSADFSDPSGYGRIIRGKNGEVVRIVEETEATPEEREITEVNTSTYVFDGKPSREYSLI